MAWKKNWCRKKSKLYSTPTGYDVVTWKIQIVCFRYRCYALSRWSQFCLTKFFFPTQRVQVNQTERYYIIIYTVRIEGQVAWDILRKGCQCMKMTTYKKNSLNLQCWENIIKHNTIKKNACVLGRKPGNGIHMYYRERIFSIRVLMNLQLFVTKIKYW